MKPVLAAFLICLSMHHDTYAQQRQNKPNPPAKMHQLSTHFRFAENVKPVGELLEQQSQGKFIPGTDSRLGFTVRTTIHLNGQKIEQTLLSIPGIVSLTVRNADPTKRDRQNYPAYPAVNGQLPVLEAILTLTSPTEKVFTRELVIGVPLAALEKSGGDHEVILNFTGVQWSMYVDGKLVDNDFAIGYPNWGGSRDWSITPNTRKAAIFFPALTGVRDSLTDGQAKADVQYWTPAGHNAWVGDVATLFHEGRYHVFYLYDRRHHASKLGVGGHYFEHFSTTDFRQWTEHEAAVPITEQWETFGTGTPFIFNNQFGISYGMHSSRIYNDSLTMYPQMMQYFQQHRKTGFFNAADGQKIPSGSTYSTSADNGLHFTKTGRYFHYSENPSVYTLADGSLRMMANYKAQGTWASPAIDSGWYAIDETFPDGGDCTFYFTWGKYEYIVGGFVHLWNRPLATPNSPWKDLVAEGKDFYNGVNVPSVAAIGNGRYVMAGWMPINGWGGPFMLHELVQHADGRIGSKWMPELVPATGSPRSLGKSISDTARFAVEPSSFIVSFTVNPGSKQSSRMALSFLPHSSDQTSTGCTLQIDAVKGTAQYSKTNSNGFADPEKSLRQDGSPQGVDNYAIEQLNDLQKPFTVRILVKHNDKLGGSIIDTEIAGRHTLVTYRQALTIKNLQFLVSGAKLKNIALATLQD